MCWIGGWSGLVLVWVDLTECKVKCFLIRMYVSHVITHPVLLKSSKVSRRYEHIKTFTPLSRYFSWKSSQQYGKWETQLLLNTNKISKEGVKNSWWTDIPMSVNWVKLFNEIDKFSNDKFSFFNWTVKHFVLARSNGSYCCTKLTFTISYISFGHYCTYSKSHDFFN